MTLKKASKCNKVYLKRLLAHSPICSLNLLCPLVVQKQISDMGKVLGKTEGVH